MKKRIISLVLAMVMVIAMLPVVAPEASAVEAGVGPKKIEGGKRDFKWPVPNWYGLSSCFMDYRDHYAIDIPAYEGTPVIASYTGDVIAAVGNQNGSTSGFGNYVVLKHNYKLIDGTTITLYSRYNHLYSVSSSLKIGETVSAGTQIGTVGNTGKSDGNHLDFQILYGGWDSYKTYSIDPYVNNLLELPSNIYPASTDNCCGVGPTGCCCFYYLEEVKEIYSEPIDSPYIVERHPTYCTISVSKDDAPIWNMPCSDKTDATATQIATADTGNTFTAVELYMNTQSNVWYKIITDDGYGYIYGGNTDPDKTKQLKDDLTLSGETVPITHQLGDVFYVEGVVAAKYQDIVQVGVEVYDRYTGQCDTGTVIDVNTKSYTLAGSDLDKAAKFNELAVGSYEYYITARIRSYYATSGTTYDTKEWTVNLCQAVFNVVESTTHTCDLGTYVYCWDAHPHYNCYACSTCGTVNVDYTSSNYYSTCASCLPGKPVLKDMKTEYETTESVVFEWDDTANTTHHNLVVLKKNDSGEYEVMNRANYAVSGYSYTTMPAGSYGVYVLAYDSDHWFDDGSDWVYTQSDIYYFDVVDKNYVTFDVNGGTLPSYTFSDTFEAFNTFRAASYMVVFNIDGQTVDTNEHGHEVAVNANGYVTSKRMEWDTNQLTVPNGGFVLSEHCDVDNPCYFIRDNIEVGDYVSYDEDSMTVYVYKSQAAYLAENKSVETGDTYGALPVPSRDGYYFDGWYTALSGGTEVVWDTVFDTDALYAHWIATTNTFPTITYDTDDNKRYEVYDYLMSWEEAKAFCESLGGHLVTITSQDENNLVTEIASQGRRGTYMLGMTDIDEEGEWVWVTGEEFVYSNWDLAYPEPSGGTLENYAVIMAVDYAENKQAGEWNDTTPDAYGNDAYTINNRGFICEYDTICDHEYEKGVCTKCGESDPDYVEYTVTFDPNGGECFTTSTTVESGTALGTMPTATYDGYEFAGWFTEAAGGTEVTSSTVITKTMTVYAHWKKPAAAKIGNVEYATFAEAMADAKSGDTVTLCADAETGNMMITSGITLDLGTYTLTADNLVALKGSAITAVTTTNDVDGGKIVIGKDNIVLPESPYVNTAATETSAAIYVIPVWDDIQECYVFSRIRANHRAFTIENDTLYYEFGHTAENYSNKTLWIDGSSDNYVSVEIQLKWETVNAQTGTTNTAYQNYVYSDSSVAKVSGGGYVYTFTLTGLSNLGITDVTNLTVTPVFRTESGAVATGTTYYGSQAGTTAE